MKAREKAFAFGLILCALLLAYSYAYLDAILAVLSETVLGAVGVSASYLEDNSNLGYTCSAAILSLFYFWLWKRIKRGYPEQPATLAFRPLGGAFRMLLIWLNFAEAVQSSIPALQSSYDTFNSEMGAFEHGDYIWMLLTVSVIGPLVEELLFRGLVFHLFERSFKSERAAVILSALLFGIWHEIFVQSVYTFMIGLILGYLYAKTRKIIWPYLVHLINNFSGTLPPGFDGEFANMLVNLASLICIPVLIILLWRMEKNTKQIEKALP